MKNPEINPCMSSQLIFGRGAKNTQWRKDNLFNPWCWENWMLTCKKMKLDPCLTPLTEINLKWIRHINIRLETVTLPKENRGKVPRHWSWQQLF